MCLCVFIVYFISYSSFFYVGIEIDDEEFVRFVERVDKDNNGVIIFEEWRDFFFFYFYEVIIVNIYYYFERVCFVDIGE